MTAHDDGISQFRQIRDLEAHLSGMRACRKVLEALTKPEAQDEKWRRKLKAVCEEIAETEERLSKLTSARSTTAHKEETKMEMQTLLKTMQADPVKFHIDLIAGNLAKVVAGGNGGESEGSKRFSLDPAIRRVIAEYLGKPTFAPYALAGIQAMQGMLEELQQQAEAEAKKAGWEDPDKKTKDLSGAASALGREAPGAEEIAKAASARGKTYMSLEALNHVRTGRQAARDLIAAARRIWGACARQATAARTQRPENHSQRIHSRRERRRRADRNATRGDFGPRWT